MRALAVTVLLATAVLALAAPSAGTPTGDRDPGVAASGRAGERCGAFEPGGDACRLGSATGVVSLELVTAFGDYPFASCRISFEVAVDGGGELRFADPTLIGWHTLCNDIWACHDPDGEPESLDKAPAAWPGSADREGSPPTVGVELCLDTCLGRFEGRVRLTLERGPRAWLLRADGAAVGLSGLELDGSWRLPERAVELLPGG